MLALCNGGDVPAGSDVTFDAGYNFALHAVSNCTWSAVAGAAGAAADKALAAAVAALNAQRSVK